MSGASLTGNVTVTAPTNFEVSTNSTSGFAGSISLAQSGGTLTGQPITVYSRIKASASAGSYIGNITLSSSGAGNKLVGVSGIVLATEPVTSASAVTFSNVGASSFTINFTSGSGTNRLVVVKQGSAVTATPVDGTSYTASTVYGSGSDLGSISDIVYNGTGNSVTVTGLTAATAYYVAVYEFNGSGGTENYKTTSPAIGNRTTLNAPYGLQIYTANTAYKVDFDSTVDGVNNGVFAGNGVESIPEPGELNSYSWAFTGFSDGNINFGDDNNEDTVYDVGTSTGGETDAGVYAFEVAPDNYALGIQPATNEFAPGTVTFRFQNQTGSAITSLSVGYKVYIYNDESGSNSFNFSHSATSNGTYTSVADLNQVTTAAADDVPGWKAYYKVITLTGLNIASNNYYYLRWSGATVSGSVFDGIALDDLVIVANPSSNYASFSGTAEAFAVAGNAQLSGNVTVNGATTFSNNGHLNFSGNTLTLSGSVTNTTSGGLKGNSSGSLVINGTTGPTLSFDQTTPGTSNAFSNFTISTTNANTTIAANAFSVNSNLTVDIGQTLNLGTNALSGSLSTINNNGTINSQNTSSTPWPSGKTWGGTGTVALNNASSAQTLVPGTYNSVTVSTTGGAVTSGDVTVNGTLNLTTANPSASTGALSTGSYTLYMGPDATDTGAGDVSGIVTHNSGIVANKLYSFGNPNTFIRFPNVGTLPTSMSLMITPGTAPAGKTDAILRNYQFIQTGGTGTKAVISAHYLDSELNGNDENRLVDWVVVVSPAQTIEQSRTNYSTTDNYVELANVNVAFFDSSFGNKILTLANAQVATSVWNGSVSDSWTTAANWTPEATPSDNTNVIIPDGATTPNDPTLNPTVTIGTLSIESGGILNAPDDSQFNITGSNGAWINAGTFNPGGGTSNVTFTNANATIAGDTDFNNITIASGALLRPLTDNQMHIAGTFTNSGTFIAGAVENTVEYTGSGQTIVTPNGSSAAYNNLIISGTGAIFPSTLNVNQSLTINQFVDFSGTTISLTGTGSQVIGGTASPQFNNLVINNDSDAVSLGVNTTVSGTLTLTAGWLSIGNYDLTLGSNAVAGSFSSSDMIVADGTGVVKRPFTGTGSYFFPIGESTNGITYSPITVNVTSGTFSDAYVAVNVHGEEHPDNHSAENYLTRYWSVTQTGITNAIATITAEYVSGDIAGNEGSISAAQLDGNFDSASNGWMKFTTLSGNTLTASNAQLTDGQTSYFTGITAQSLTAEITGEGTFCEDTEVTLTANATGGDAPYTYEWDNGLGNGETAMPPTDTAGTTVYTLTVRDANGVEATDTATMIITDPPVAGTLTGAQNICAGTTPSDITLTGYTGTIVRWERSTTTAFTNPAFIASTSATLTGAEIGNITSTRYLRAVVQNGSCPVVYSDYVAITVPSTTWDGSTWSAGVPDASTTAIFTGNYTASGDINACSMQVNNGAVVLIPSGDNVTLNGAILVSNGTVTFENNSNLIQLTDAVNSGNIIFHKNSSALYRLDYTIWSAPVTGQNLLDFSPLTLTNRFYYYITSSNLYDPVPDPANTDFTPGQGYLIRMPNSNPLPGYNTEASTLVFDGIFTGVPNNGTINVTLSTNTDGYNMVGNPYPSPINIHDFFDDNTSAIDSGSALYFWRKTNDATQSTYATITKLAYTANPAPGGDTGSSTFTGDPSEWVINPGQGFFVEATGSNLVFTNSMRRAVNNGQFFRSGQDSQPAISRYWLNMSNSEGIATQSAVGYTNETTNDIDYGWDGKIVPDDGPIALYSVAVNINLAIQARAPFNSNDIVTVGYRADQGGSYTIALDHADGIFASDQDIYIKDNYTGFIHNLKSGSYSFATEAGTFNDRFDIIYETESLGTQTPVFNDKQVMVYKQGDVININSGNLLMKQVTVFDTRGRLLYKLDNIDSAETSLTGLQAQQEVLILKINTDKGEVTKKVVY